MKKITLLIFLVFFSCTKNQEINNNTNIKTDSKKITKTEIYSPSKEELSIEKEKISKETLSNFSKKTLQEQNDFNCEDIHPVYDGMSQKETEVRTNFITSCNELKQQAQKELDKKISEFKVTDCEKLITSKIGQIDDKYKKDLIQTCEMNLAIKNGCEKLKDETKVKKCNEYKELKEKNDNLKMIEDFDLINYL